MDANLYFLFAKISGLLLSPTTLFVTAIFAGFFLILTSWDGAVHFGKWLMGWALLAYVVTTVFPGGYILVNILEERFPQPSALSQPVEGIIVLGGSSNTVLSATRAQVSLNDNAERLTEFLTLARAYPDAKLVFTGGIGKLSGVGPTEAQIARQFFADMGLDPARVVFEDRSRNTAESAQMTYEQLNPSADQTWLLVTSAKHMPRAVGLFRKAGWTVTAYPVDYTTLPSAYRHFKPSWPGQLSYIDAAVYEWGGLLVNWLRGSIDEPFPKPTQHLKPKPAPPQPMTSVPMAQPSQ